MKVTGRVWKWKEEFNEPNQVNVILSHPRPCLLEQWRHQSPQFIPSHQLQVGCHKNNMSSKCPKCPFLAKPMELEEHMSIHRSKPRPSIASQLISASLGDDAASPSEKEGEPKEKKKCDICKKDLAVSSVSRHMKDKHGGLYKCTICGKNYKTTTALESHQEKAHVVKTISNFECDFCNYKTMNKYYLNDHMKRQHAGAGSNSFVCSKCFARK